MAPMSLDTLSTTLAAKVAELAHFENYSGTPEQFAADCSQSIPDLVRLFNTPCVWNEEGWVRDQIRKASVETLRAAVETLNEALSNVALIAGIFQNPRMRDAIMPSDRPMFDAKRADLSRVRDAFQARIPSPKSQKVQSGSETEESESQLGFSKAMQKRKASGKTFAKKVKGVKMSLGQFHSMEQIRDEEPFHKIQDIWGFTQRDARSLAFRTHPILGYFVKATGVQISKSNCRNYKPADIQRKVIIEAKYMLFSECAAGILKGAAESDLIPEGVLTSALAGGLFSEDLKAVGEERTFEQIEAEIPGAGEIADIIYYQARAETELKDIGAHGKLPFVRKWFRRLADVPDSLRGQAGEAARHFFTWIRNDCSRKPDDRDINGVFNGFVQGMLAKWPKNMDRDTMIKKYRPNVKALWGDLADLFIAEFKKTEMGRHEVRPAENSATARLRKAAAIAAAKAAAAVDKVVAMGTAAPAAIREQAATLAQESLRLDNALTWREQMQAWRGRFTRSLPDFIRSAPKPLRVFMSTETGRSEAAPQGRLATAKRWAAATVGFAFVKPVSFQRPTTDPSIVVTDTVYAPRPWLRWVFDTVYQREVTEQETRIYDPVPGLVGTAVAIGETLKYCLWDLPKVAINRVGAVFMNLDEDPVIETPEKPHWARALMGTIAAGTFATIGAVAAGPAAMASGVTFAATGLISLLTMDTVNWLRGRKFDSKAGQFYTPVPEAKDDEPIDLQAVDTVFDAEMEDISLADNRSQSVESDKGEGPSKPSEGIRSPSGSSEPSLPAQV